MEGKLPDRQPNWTGMEEVALKEIVGDFAAWKLEYWVAVELVENLHTQDDY